MRWKPKKKRQLEDCEKRTVNQFLLLPKLLDDEWRWLESAQIAQEYWFIRGDWVDLHWAEKEKKQ